LVLALGFLLVPGGGLLGLDLFRRSSPSARGTGLGGRRLALVRAALRASRHGLLQVVELRAALEADVLGAQVARHRPPRRSKRGAHSPRTCGSQRQACHLLPAPSGRLTPYIEGAPPW